MNLKNRNVLIGITAGVAIYKVCELVRKLISLGAKVKCIMTSAATKLISPVLFEHLCKNKVYTEMFVSHSAEEYDPLHISLSSWADIIIVAPCSCNTLSKLSHGKTEDLLTSTIYACDLKKTKVIICPSMNSNMWEHPITQQNIKILKEIGYKIIPPEKGELLCEKSGVGRLPSIEKILNYIKSI